MTQNIPKLADILCMNAFLHKIASDETCTTRSKYNSYRKTHETFLEHFKPHIPVSHKLDVLQPEHIMARTETQEKLSPIPFNSKMKFQLKDDNTFIANAFFKIEIADLKTTSPDSGDLIRLVRFPAHKILKRVCFYENDALIDEYYSDHYNIHYETELSSSEKSIWQSLVGDSDNESGYQAFQTSHDQCSFVIPVLFWFQKLENGYLQKKNKNSCIVVDTADITELISYYRKLDAGYQIPDLNISLIVRSVKFPQYFVDAYISNQVAIPIRSHGLKKYSVNMISDNEVFIFPLISKQNHMIESIHIQFISQENHNHSQKWTLTQDVCDVALIPPNLRVQKNIGMIPVEMIKDVFWFTKSTQKMIEFMNNKHVDAQSNTISIRGNLLNQNNPSGYLSDDLCIACKLKSGENACHPCGAPRGVQIPPFKGIIAISVIYLCFLKS